MQAAAQAAEKRGNPSVEPEHLLLELLQQSEGVVPRLFEKQGLSVKAMIEDLKQKIDRFPKVSGSNQKVYASPRLEKVFSVADSVVKDWGDGYISTEHFLLAMFGLGDAELSSFFKKHHIKHDPTVAALRAMRGTQKVTDDEPENKDEIFEQVRPRSDGLSSEGKLDPPFGSR